VKALLGSDLGGSIVVLDVRFEPIDGREVGVYLDDFWLHSSKDGQKAQPYSPSQIAGSGVLVVSTTSSGGVGADPRGPVWPGGGPGGTGRPRRIGGDGGAVGNTGSASGAEATVVTGGKTKEDPMLAVLKDKVLPEKLTKEPVTGLLYFMIEGKVKPKDLSLVYRGRTGRVVLEFR
jgi:hypothetical protein